MRHIEAGEGFRLLAVGETIQSGDSFRPLGQDCWLMVFQARVDQVVTQGHVAHRRKIVPDLSLPSGIEAIVCSDITARQRLGVEKYGTTVADNPLSLREWLQHSYEECLDQAIYLRRAIDEL